MREHAASMAAIAIAGLAVIVIIAVSTFRATNPPTGSADDDIPLRSARVIESGSARVVESGSARVVESGSDRAVLVALYDTTGGDGWLIRTNWLSDGRSGSGTESRPTRPGESGAWTSPRTG